MFIFDARWAFFFYLLVCNASLDETVLDELEIETNSIFPPMFVLNLKRSTDRWISAEKQMNGEGLIVERFDAIDGRALSDSELRNSSTRYLIFIQILIKINVYKFVDMVYGI